MRQLLESDPTPDSDIEITFDPSRPEDITATPINDPDD
jgi:hypothetical protein